MSLDIAPHLHTSDAQFEAFLAGCDAHQVRLEITNTMSPIELRMLWRAGR